MKKKNYINYKLIHKLTKKKCFFFCSNRLEIQLDIFPLFHIITRPCKSLVARKDSS